MEQLKGMRRCLRWCLAALMWSFLGLAQAAMTPSEALHSISESGEAAVMAYTPDPASGERTAAEFSRLYFDVFEAAGVELMLGSRDRSLMQKIELGFAKCIQAGLERRLPEAMRGAWEGLRADLALAGPMVADGESGTGVAVAGQAAVIVLREGLEALLVVSALAAFLRRSGQSDRLRWLWGGVTGGMVASALLAWGVSDLLAMAGAWRGAAQGLMVMLASLMLAQMAAWMYARRSAERWNQVLREHMVGAIDGTPWLILVVAFVAVFREGAETILFFHALGAAAAGQWRPLAGGATIAAAALVVLYLIFQRMGRRLPYSAFFIGTASLLLVVSLVFAGKGALFLQMSGWLPSTDWAAIPTIGWLGLYPLRETVLAQAIVIGVIVGWVLLGSRPPRVNLTEVDRT